MIGSNDLDDYKTYLKDSININIKSTKRKIQTNRLFLIVYFFSIFSQLFFVIYTINEKINYYSIFSIICFSFGAYIIINRNNKEKEKINGYYEELKKNRLSNIY